MAASEKESMLMIVPEGTDFKQKFGDMKACLKKYKRSIAAH